MSTTASPAEILPEQIDIPAPDAVAVQSRSFLRRSREAVVLRVTEPEQDDEAEREKRASERLDVDDLPRAPVEPETGEDQT